MNYRIKPTTHAFSSLTSYHPQRKLFCFWLNITPYPLYTYYEAKIALLQHLSQSLPSRPSPALFTSIPNATSTLLF